MFAWIAGNAGTLIVVAVVLALVAVAVFSLVKEKKNKKSCCTGNCASCHMGCLDEKKTD
ncbi:MAG: FeoB-associated Cys-rich membrane protein [Clostridia bacterium]|nr:FeoB-associated Cys-rich membrane protein [Clostridia bacterium]